MRGGVKSEEKELGRRCRLGREEESDTKAGAHRQQQNWKLTQKKLFLFFATGAQSAKLNQREAPPPWLASSAAFYTTNQDLED